MNNQEALRKIDEINAVIHSSNRAPLSGRALVAQGAFGLLILAGWMLLALRQPHWSMYHHRRETALFLAALLAGSLLIRRFLHSEIGSPSQRAALHPLLLKVFSLRRPLCLMMAVIALILLVQGQPYTRLALPLGLVATGFYYLLLGSFSIAPVRGIAWSQIAVGLAVLGFSSRIEAPKVSFLVTYGEGFYLCLSCIAMGICLMRHPAARSDA